MMGWLEVEEEDNPYEGEGGDVDDFLVESSQRVPDRRIDRK